MQISVPASKKAEAFPDVRFQTVAVEAQIGVTFKLRDNNEVAAARRAIEAAKKLLSDHGATVEVAFGKPS